MIRGIEGDKGRIEGRERERKKCFNEPTQILAGFDPCYLRCIIATRVEPRQFVSPFDRGSLERNRSIRSICSARISTTDTRSFRRRPCTRAQPDTDVPVRVKDRRADRRTDREGGFAR